MLLQYHGRHKRILPLISLYPDIALRYLYQRNPSMSKWQRGSKILSKLKIVRIRTYISKFFFIEKTILDIEVAKRVFLECHLCRTRYRIWYRCRYMIFSSKTGPIVPFSPSRDSNEEIEMDVDDLFEYMDQETPGGGSLLTVPYCRIWTNHHQWHYLWLACEIGWTWLQKTLTWHWRAFQFLWKDQFHQEYLFKWPYR